MKRIISCVICTALLLALSMQVVMAANKYLAGDIDGNGKVEASEALEILKIVTKLEPMQDIADVNQDKVVDAVDALIELRMAVELEHTHMQKK